MIMPYFHPHWKKKEKEKYKKRFLLLFGYQLSNLGWIGAWFAADKFGVGSIPFVLCVSLICLADIFILWKEI